MLSLVRPASSSINATMRFRTEGFAILSRVDAMLMASRSSATPPTGGCRLAEELRGIHAKYVAKFLKSAGRYAISARLVFLQLLKADTERLAERSLVNAGARANGPDLGTQLSIKVGRASLVRRAFGYGMVRRCSDIDQDVIASCEVVAAIHVGTM